MVGLRVQKGLFMKAVVFTLGCKVNSRESAAIMQGLKERGYDVSDELGYADLFVVNTCAVTSEAEKKSRQAIARVKKYNPNAKIIVCGCASQNNPEAFAEKGVFALIGAKNKDKIFDLLDIGGIDIEKNDFYYDAYLPCKGKRTREYVKIQDGCNCFCSYCIIPYLRGRSRSREADRVKEEILTLSPIEAVLTGINITDYHTEKGDLADLLIFLGDVKCRIRLGSIEVSAITDRLLEAAKKLYDFAPHFHLSLQSGSDSVLKSMNRHYTASEYGEKVNLIRKHFPQAAITTDVIVGYSTETEECFKESFEFCKKVGFADIHCFPYSVRKGTVGAKLKPLSESIKKERLNKMLCLKEKLKKEYTEKFIGQILDVVIEEEEEGYYVGYSGNYIRVYVKGCGFGKVKVKGLALYKEGLLCEKQI